MVGGPRVCAVLLAAALAPALPARGELILFPRCDADNGLPCKRVTVGVKEWFSSGSGEFRKSFPFPFPTTPAAFQQNLAMGSTLNFDKLAANMTVFTGELRPVGWLSAAFDYGVGSIGGGVGHDHDWINGHGVTLFSPAGNVYDPPAFTDFSLSQSSLAGEVRFYTPTLYLRTAVLRDDGGAAYVHFLDVGAGYTWYTEDIRLSNLVQLASPDAFFDAAMGIPPPGPYAGQYSGYRFHWEGVRLALREKVLIGPKFSSEGKFGFVPLARFTGTGVWNLRSDLRQDPSFTQTATGQGYDFSLDVAYKAVESVSLRAGYMLQYFAAHDGLDTAHTVAHGDATDNLDRVRTFRSGAFAGAAISF